MHWSRRAKREWQVKLKTYFDFAEDDYRFLQRAREQGIIANSMGEKAKSVCERYMKSIIDKYSAPRAVEDIVCKINALNSRDLVELMTYLNTKMSLCFSNKTQADLLYINRMSDTLYPGEESIVLNPAGIDKCFMVMSECRNEIMRFEKMLR
jgi:hypothetical protein